MLQRKTTITYCKNSDLRLRFPDIKNYLDSNWSDQNVEHYLNEMRNQSHLWINNQLEAFELQTFALDNDKRIIEADYSIYLVLRGSSKRVSPDLLERFLSDSRNGLAEIEKKKSSRKNLNSQTSRFSRQRTKMKDFGNLGDR